MTINFLLPDNLDDALLNWAAWHSSAYDPDAYANPVSLTYAIAVDALYDALHYREKDAIRCNYLQGVDTRNQRHPRGLKFTEAALVTAKQSIEQGLRVKKLISN